MRRLQKSPGLYRARLSILDGEQEKSQVMLCAGCALENPVSQDQEQSLPTRAEPKMLERILPKKNILDMTPTQRFDLDRDQKEAVLRISLRLEAILRLLCKDRQRVRVELDPALAGRDRSRLLQRVLLERSRHGIIDEEPHASARWGATKRATRALMMTR